MLLPLGSSWASVLLTAILATAGLPVAGDTAGTPASRGAGPAALARAADASARTPSPTWVGPLNGLLVVVDPFDPPARDWLPGHRGVDLAAVRGSVVHAAGDGVVIWAGPVAGRGVLVVLHADGRRTTYEPVDPLVAVGGEVLAGDAIGVVVRGTGHCGGSYPCLHWGLVRGDTYLDPMRLLDPREPVLLPLGAGP